MTKVRSELELYKFKLESYETLELATVCSGTVVIQ